MYEQVLYEQVITFEIFLKMIYLVLEIQLSGTALNQHAQGPESDAQC